LIKEKRTHFLFKKKKEKRNKERKGRGAAPFTPSHCFK